MAGAAAAEAAPEVYVRMYSRGVFFEETGLERKGEPSSLVALLSPAHMHLYVSLVSAHDGGERYVETTTFARARTALLAGMEWVPDFTTDVWPAAFSGTFTTTDDLEWHVRTARETARDDEIPPVVIGMQRYVAPLRVHTRRELHEEMRIALDFIGAATFRFGMSYAQDSQWAKYMSCVYFIPRGPMEPAPGRAAQEVPLSYVYIDDRGIGVATHRQEAFLHLAADAQKAREKAAGSLRVRHALAAGMEWSEDVSDAYFLVTAWRADASPYAQRAHTLGTARVLLAFTESVRRLFAAHVTDHRICVPVYHIVRQDAGGDVCASALVAYKREPLLMLPEGARRRRAEYAYAMPSAAWLDLERYLFKSLRSITLRGAEDGYKAHLLAREPEDAGTLYPEMLTAEFGNGDMRVGAIHGRFYMRGRGARAFVRAGLPLISTACALNFISELLVQVAVLTHARVWVADLDVPGVVVAHVIMRDVAPRAPGDAIVNPSKLLTRIHPRGRGGGGGGDGDGSAFAIARAWAFDAIYGFIHENDERDADAAVPEHGVMFPLWQNGRVRLSLRRAPAEARVGGGLEARAEGERLAPAREYIETVKRAVPSFVYAVPVVVPHVVLPLHVAPDAPYSALRNSHALIYNRESLHHDQCYIAPVPLMAFASPREVVNAMAAWMKAPTAARIAAVGMAGRHVAIRSAMDFIAVYTNASADIDTRKATSVAMHEYVENLGTWDREDPDGAARVRAACMQHQVGVVGVKVLYDQIIRAACGTFSLRAAIHHGRFVEPVSLMWAHEVTLSASSIKMPTRAADDDDPDEMRAWVPEWARVLAAPAFTASYMNGRRGALERRVGALRNIHGEAGLWLPWVRDNTVQYDAMQGYFAEATRMAYRALVWVLALTNKHVALLGEWDALTARAPHSIATLLHVLGPSLWIIGDMDALPRVPYEVHARLLRVARYLAVMRAYVYATREAIARGVGDPTVCFVARILADIPAPRRAANMRPIVEAVQAHFGAGARERFHADGDTIGIESVRVRYPDTTARALRRNLQERETRIAAVLSKYLPEAGAEAEIPAARARALHEDLAGAADEMGALLGRLLVPPLRGAPADVASIMHPEELWTRAPLRRLVVETDAGAAEVYLGAGRAAD